MGERTFNRAERRQVLTGPSRARNPRPKAGTPQHFKVWKHEAAAKALLDKARTAELADDPWFGRYRSGIASIAEKFPTVWRLSHADRATLLKIAGVGDVTLRKLQDYLEAKNVAIAWGVK